MLQGLNLDLNLESVAGFKFGFKFGLNLNLNWKVSLKCFFQKNDKVPLDYLIVVSGGSFLLEGGSNKDTRRCFLWCLQASTSSSLLFSIEF